MERDRRGGDQAIPRPELWTPGSPAPWLGSDRRARERPADEVLEAVAKASAARPLQPEPGARNSAVLIALTDGPHGAEVLLTRRSQHLSNHRGEISFPGGRMDPGETPVETALRESWEEVGLDPAAVEVRAELEHLSTIVSRSYIVPVVGVVRSVPPLRPATAEVDRIMFVPLAELARPETHREEIWHAPAADYSMHFFELADETVWGVTARMLMNLLSLVYG